MHGIQTNNRPCTLCACPASMWCSRCQSAWYCCPEHLQSDWLRHRKECVPPTYSTNARYSVNMIATPPPAEPQYVSVSAILFAPEEERPRVTTVICRPASGSSHGGMCPIPIGQFYFPYGITEGIVLTQSLNGQALQFPFHLWYSPTALQRNSPVNRSIYNITSGSAPKAWCGGVVVLKYNDSRLQGYANAGFNDLPPLSAYFLDYKYIFSLVSPSE
ncbi:hypothetical protein L218DRAFT_1028165 [Marasmius fiardii PR-910]|nr:hypothetical protein L218DRAFT_1028165 [Marasmius fiardii PR-910]